MTEETVMTYWAKLGLDASEFIGGITEAQKGFLAFTAAAAGMAYAAKIAFDTYLQNTKKFGEMAENLKDLSYQTGMSTAKLQQLQNAATLSNDSFETVATGLNKLTLTMGEFTNKSSAAAKAFQSLGVDPTGKTVDQVFDQIAVSMGKIESPTTRAAAAVALFGRNGKEMLPFMEDMIKNAGKISEIRILTDDQLERLSESQKRVALLGMKIDYLYADFFGGSISPTEGYGLSKTPWGTQAEMEARFAAKQTGRDATTLAAERAARIAGEGSVTNPFLGLTGNAADLKVLTDHTLPKLRTELEDAIEAGDPKKIDEARIAVWKAEIQVGDLTKAIEKEGKERTKTNRDNKLQLQELTDITIPALQKAYDAIKFSGAKIDIEKASIALQEAKNKADDLKTALYGAAGAAATYNTMFASSIQTGGVGPDWAGFSDLANLTEEELKKYAAGEFAYTHGSTATKEKAQQYLDRMKTGGGAKPGAGGTKAGATDLNKNVKTGMDDLKKITEEGYIELDKLDTTHWTKLTKLIDNTYDTAIIKEVSYFNLSQEDLLLLDELQVAYWTNLTSMQSTAYNAMAASDAQFTKFVAENPTIKNIGVVVWTKYGADWDPTKDKNFMQTVRVAAVMSNVPTFVAPKFNQISMTGGAGTGSAAGADSKTVTITIHQTNHGVKTDAEGINKALGNLAALGSGLP